MINQTELVDPNLYKEISKCFINNKRSNLSEIVVIYDDDIRERIWSFNPKKFDFDFNKFIGMTKIEAVFYCDKKSRKDYIL